MKKICFLAIKCFSLTNDKNITIERLYGTNPFMEEKIKI